MHLGCFSKDLKIYFIPKMNNIGVIHYNYKLVFNDFSYPQLTISTIFTFHTLTDITIYFFISRLSYHFQQNANCWYNQKDIVQRYIFVRIPGNLEWKLAKELHNGNPWAVWIKRDINKINCYETCDSVLNSGKMPHVIWLTKGQLQSYTFAFSIVLSL